MSRPLGVGCNPPLLLCLWVLAATPAAAQYPQLDGRVADHTRQAALPLLDSARTAGLPLDPMVNKVLEGVAKGADDGRIVTALRALLGALKGAREALGTDATPAELTAGAIALRAGATTAALRQLREARRGQPLVVPLSVLSDLVARGVPPDTAAAVILEGARTRKSDGDFTSLRQQVEDDISHGVSPGTAAIREHRDERVPDRANSRGVDIHRPSTGPMRLETFTGFSSWTPHDGPTVSAVSGGAQLNGEQWSAMAESRFWLGWEGAVDVDGGLAGSYRKPLGGRLAVEWKGDAGAFRPSFTTPSAHLFGAGNLRMDGDHRGFWVGAGGSRLRMESAWQTVAAASAGVWVERGPLAATLSLTFTQVPEFSRVSRGGLVPTGDTLGTSVGGGERTSITSPSGSFQDVGLKLRWERGSLRLETNAGLRFGGTTVDGKSWGTVTGAIQLTPNLALVGVAGSEPRDLARGVPAKGLFSLGFRMTPRTSPRPVLMPAAATVPLFEVVTLSDQMRWLQVRIAAASRVDLAGDFTQWRPMKLAPFGVGVWGLDLQIPPGSYRCSIRVDGGRWTAPPGLAGISDEFGGEAGIVQFD